MAASTSTLPDALNTLMVLRHVVTLLLMIDVSSGRWSVPHVRTSVTFGLGRMRVNTNLYASGSVHGPVAAG